MLRKTYEVFHKDVQLFIEIYLTGKKKSALLTKETECKKQTKQMDSSNLHENGILSFSLLSENTQFENFLNQSTNLVNKKFKSLVENKGKFYFI